MWSGVAVEQALRGGGASGSRFVGVDRRGSLY